MKWIQKNLFIVSYVRQEENCGYKIKKLKQCTFVDKDSGARVSPSTVFCDCGSILPVDIGSMTNGIFVTCAMVEPNAKFGMQNSRSRMDYG